MTITAPQHDDTQHDHNSASQTTPQQSAKVLKEQGNSPCSKRQKLQRCWFVTLGLLGGFGFITSQMGFAIAQTDFLTTDYSASAGDSLADDYTADYTAAYTAQTVGAAALDATEPAAIEVTPGNTQTLAQGTYTSSTYTSDAYTSAQPTFEVEAINQDYQPTPEAFIAAPTTSAATVESLTEAAFVEATPTAVTAAQPTPPSTDSEARAAGTTELDGASITFEITPAAAPQSAPAQSATQSTTQSTQTTQATAAQSTAAATVSPTVTAPAAPTFTSDAKLAAHKPVARGSRHLAGLMEASVVAGSVSTYTQGQTALVSNVVADSAADTDRVLLAMGDEPSVEAPAAVPDILPASEPVAPAAPPIVEVEPAPVLAPEPAPVVETAPPIQATEIVPAALPEGTNLPDEYNSVFVDPTDYSVGATEAPNVVVSERSTGCAFTVGQGQVVPNGACGVPTAPAPVANQGGSGYQAPAAVNAPAWQNAPSAPVANEPGVNVGPVSFSASGIQLSTSAAGREYLNRSVRPLVNLQASEQFIFPLAIPSPITSLFGFRRHPITGDQRFHAGTDIGAEQGTPVLAAQDGVVASANFAGGYGLMVVLQHTLEETQLESRYAHLAEIFVEAGSEVKKGDIIGLVGSTGSSTGPHLHFEMRQMTADGWVLVNADGLVQASLANLVRALNNPLETLSFNLSDFNLSNLRARGSIQAPTTTGIPTFPGQDGIPFRPAQPNAS